VQEGERGRDRQNKTYKMTPAQSFESGTPDSQLRATLYTYARQALIRVYLNGLTRDRHFR